MINKYINAKFPENFNFKKYEGKTVPMYIDKKALNIFTQSTAIDVYFSTRSFKISVERHQDLLS